MGHVTVLFSIWEGIRSNYRVALTGSTCDARLDKVKYLKRQDATFNFEGQVVTSKRISSYIDYFLSQFLSGERYIAVMLRTENYPILLHLRVIAVLVIL